jgi:hypothetical protein
MDRDHPSDEDNEDNDDAHGHNPEDSKEDNKTGNTDMLACPYFKYDPTTYKKWRNCPGPGWPDIHRVK